MVIPGSNRVNTQQISAISDFDTDISGTTAASASETDGDSFHVKHRYNVNRDHPSHTALAKTIRLIIKTVTKL